MKLGWWKIDRLRKELDKRRKLELAGDGKNLAGWAWLIIVVIAAAIVGMVHLTGVLR